MTRHAVLRVRERAHEARDWPALLVANALREGVEGAWRRMGRVSGDYPTRFVDSGGGVVRARVVAGRVVTVLGGVEARTTEDACEDLQTSQGSSVRAALATAAALAAAGRNYAEGHAAGYDAGYTAGHAAGRAVGYTAGHAAGYDAGREVSEPAEDRRA